MITLTEDLLAYQMTGSNNRQNCRFDLKKFSAQLIQEVFILELKCLRKRGH